MGKRSPPPIKPGPGGDGEQAVEKLLGLGIVVQIVACGVVGTRLLILATRTRQAPELLLGAAFLLLGVVGYPLAIAARAGGDPSTGLLTTALAVQNVACLCMYATTWRTFRADSRTAGVLIDDCPSAFFGCCFPVASLRSASWRAELSSERRLGPPVPVNSRQRLVGAAPVSVRLPAPRR